MADHQIVPIKMPKWGLSMQEGKVVDWLKPEGAQIREGEDLVDVETSKITNVAEAPASGTLRRIVAQSGDTLPVGALMAVLADPAVPDADIDAFVTDFNANFVVEDGDGEGGGLVTRTIEAAGKSLRVGVAGEGQGGAPALLIHGFGGDLENWTLAMGPLAEARPVYALELPGHGQSDKAVGDASVAAMAKVVVAAMEALGLSRAHLVGHSWGGAIALAAALAAPTRVASLSLVASAGVPGSRVNPDYLDGFIDARRTRDLQRVAEMLFADKAMASAELVEGLSRYKRLDGVEGALRAIRDAMVDTGELAALSAKLGDVGAPLLIVYASNDEVVSAPDESALPASAAKKRIDGSGHLPQIERAAETTAALRTHMASAD